jgi:hypothetical protein
LTAESTATAANIEDMFTWCGLEQTHDAIPLGDRGN